MKEKQTNPERETPDTNSYPVVKNNSRRLPELLYFSGLLIIAVSLPLSQYMMSIGQWVLAFAWLAGGDFKNKLRNFVANRAALLVCSLFVLHLAGLLYTSDIEYGLKDVRIKIPLFVLPFILSTGPLISRKQFAWLTAAFVAAVFAATMASMGVILGIISHYAKDIRDTSIFISHIRFSLLICLSVFMLIYFIYTGYTVISLTRRLLLFLLAAWFVAFLVITESITGLAILGAGLLLTISYFIFTEGKAWYRIVFLMFLVTGTLTFVLYVRQTMHEVRLEMPVNPAGLQPYTANGNPYVHTTSSRDAENGHPVWIYICRKEMEEEWNRRSLFSFTGKDQKGQLIESTLIRFLSSKGIRKDAAGVSSLSDSEVHDVERGITNVRYRYGGSIRARIYQIVWEYNSYLAGDDPSGHSVMQRLEFWKAAAGIISDHPVFGVGTGDIKNAFDEKYVQIKSPLFKAWRLRAHNQFLAIAVAFGYAGLAWFLIILIYPLLNKETRGNYLYLMFFMIVFFSMLTEDTLETQAGATFFAFFNSLLLFGCSNEKEK